VSAALEKSNINLTASYEKIHNPFVLKMNWLKTSIDSILTATTTDFFGVKIKGFLVGLTKKPLYFWKENDYFVTQISLTANCSIQLRISNTASGIFLEESLGKRHDNEKYFKFKNITRLESEMLSSYCELLVKNLKPLFIETRKINKRKEPSKELMHLTMYVNTPNRLKQDMPCGRIILSFPPDILKKGTYPEVEYPVDISKFYSSTSETNVYIGRSLISLIDLKKLSINDVLILEQSQLDRMEIFDEKRQVPFKVRPDRNIELNIHSEEYGGMNNEALNVKKQGEAIWDNIQVEVAAEFKKIKLPLGELRNMTEGLVVEVASLVDNEVRLHIDGKDLAIGELVIVGDKYGVMINKVLHKNVPGHEEPEEDIIQEDNIAENNIEEDDDIDFNYDDNYDDLGIEDEF
jgi:flagellar motor switch/type III secretory pathway protein FliN